MSTHQQNESNVQHPTDGEIEKTLSQLSELANSQEAPEQESARAWLKALQTSHIFLTNRQHSIVFIGEAGVGKSSLVAVTAGLLVSNTPPSDRSALKKQSLLSIGAGRTTLCEVEIRSPQPGDESTIGLLIQPKNKSEMDLLIRQWAEDEWRRRQPGLLSRMGADTLPTPTEVARALAAMTGYSEYSQVLRDASGASRPRTVRPLDEIVPQYTTHEELTEHLRSRCRLNERNQTAWWWPSTKNQPDSLQELKDVVEAINLGKQADACLPDRITLIIPKILPDIAQTLDLRLQVIDTRGLDAGVGLPGRADLQSFASDPRAILVLCTPFKAAPGDAVRSLLRGLKDDVRWRPTLSRVLVVLLDHGDAEQVNGADGDRRFGQLIKANECWNVLSDAGIGQNINSDQIVVMDVLSDSSTRMVDALKARLTELREQATQQRNSQWRTAQDFLLRQKQASQQQRAQDITVIDEEIRRVLTQSIPNTDATPLNDPMTGLYQAIQATRYASVIYASCRRHGEYSSLNLYSAVTIEASRAASQWVTVAVQPVQEYLEQQVNQAKWEPVQDHIRLRQQQFLEARNTFVLAYAGAVEKQVQNLLRNDTVIWNQCQNEWGNGGGFKQAVLNHLEQWAKRQAFDAHLNTHQSATAIPFWPDVAPQHQAPRFKLHVQRLRAIGQANWDPEPVSLLIGANGAGKTTLLQTLKFLRSAYERGLSEAVSLVFRGSYQLKTRGTSDSDPIEIGLEIGAINWRMTLNLQGASANNVTHEWLTENGKEVFSRNPLTGLRHRNEYIETDSHHIGLRILMDHGSIDPSVRTVATLLQRIALYQEPDLWNLRIGSPASDDQILHSRGGNTLAVLRRWHQDRSQSHRYNFVMTGLAAAFPTSFEILDFETAGNTLAARVYRPGSETPSPLDHEANGLLQMLVLLCAIASGDEGGVVAIDEPENGLHPYALRIFLRRAQQWANNHHLTILLATHSTVLLDEFTSRPESVFVMNAPGMAQHPTPTPLSELCSREWLEGFKLGDLYEQDEIGSNSDGL